MRILITNDDGIHAPGLEACETIARTLSDDVWIVATDETPIPYSPTLEDAFIPDADAIVASVRERLRLSAG